MEIKEFAFRNNLDEPLSIKEAIDQDVLYQVIAAAKHASIGNHIRKHAFKQRATLTRKGNRIVKRRGIKQWFLRALRRLSSKGWF
jgi:hypothetical protein